MRYRKDVGEFIKYARARGFECEGMTGSGHWRLRHTSGAVIIAPATPGGGSRWRQNLEAYVRQIIKGEQS